MEEVEAIEIKKMMGEIKRMGVKYPRSAARLSLFLDFNDEKEVTQQFYSQVWGWHRREVVNFIESQGLQLKKINKEARKTKSKLILSDGHKKHPLFNDLAQNMDIKNGETGINCALNGHKNSNDSDNLNSDLGINCALNGHKPENANISGHKISSENGGLEENVHTAIVVDVVVEEQQTKSEQSNQGNDDLSEQELTQWAWDITNCQIELGTRIPYPSKYAESLIKGKTKLTAENIRELELLQYQVDNKTNSGGSSYENYTGNGNADSWQGLPQAHRAALEYIGGL